MSSSLPNLDKYLDQAAGSGFGARWSGWLGEFVGFLLMAAIVGVGWTSFKPQDYFFFLPAWLLVMYSGEMGRRFMGNMAGWERLYRLRKRIPLQDRIEPSVAGALDQCAQAALAADKSSRQWRSRFDLSRVEPNVERAMEYAIQIAGAHVQWQRPRKNFGPVYTPSEACAAILDIAIRLQSAADQMATRPMNPYALKSLLN